MAKTDLTAADLNKLREWDTPTICNGLEHLSSEYRVKSFTVEQMQCFDPSLPPIIGYARTAMIRSMTPPEGKPEDIREMRARYYETISAPPNPSISVIQDLDPVCHRHDHPYNVRVEEERHKHAKVYPSWRSDGAVMVR